MKRKYYNINLEIMGKILLVVFIYQLCRVGFYLFNTELFIDMTFGKLLYYMLAGLRFDISAILYTNLLFLLLSLLPFKFTFKAGYRKAVNIIFYVFNAIGISANVSDFIYYRFTSRRTTASVFDFMAGESNMGKLWIQFFVDYWYATLTGIGLIFLLVYISKKIPRANLQIHHPVWHFLSRTVLLVLFSGLIVAGLRGGVLHSTRPITLSNAGEYVEIPNEVSIVLNTPFSIIRTIGKTSIKHQEYFSDNELEAVYTPIHPPQSSQVVRHKNVMIIILESFSAEHSKFLNPDLENGNYQGYTPFLDSLMQQSLTFRYSYANGHKSIDALPSVFTSIPSLEVPYLLSPYSSNAVESLPGILKEEGYHTSFFHGAPNGSMGFQAYCNLIGIENYYGKKEYNNNDDYDGIWGIWDEPFLQYMAHTVNTFKEPFFTSVFTLSSHHPFKVPEQYEGVFPKGTIPVHQCVGYSDMALKKFFKTISNMPWFKNTLFVFTADHTVRPAHREYSTIENRYRIPIFFYSPDGSLTGQKDEVVQQIDIFPSVLGYLGYNKKYFAFGSDVFNRNNSGWAITFPNGIYQYLTKDFAIQFEEGRTRGFFKRDKILNLSNNMVSERLPQMQRMEAEVKAIIQQYHNRMLEDRLTSQND